jgi:peptidoglycan/LPS O-acetylase OafA/YrhL
LINAAVKSVGQVRHKAANVLARPGFACVPVLRFAAALFMVVFHFSDHAPIPLKTLNPIFTRGWIATDFFIMLSGFILSRAYSEKLAAHSVSFQNFMIKRVSRIWPLHALVMFCLLLVMGFAYLLNVDGIDKLTIQTWLAQVFLLNSFFETAHTWNGPSWTLSALVVCYALFYGYARLMARQSPWLLVVIAVGILFIAQCLALNLAERSMFDLPYEWTLMRAIPLFLFGSLIEQAGRGISLKPMSYFVIVSMAIAEMVWLAGLPRSLLNDNTILLVLVMITVMSGNVSLPESPLTSRLGRGSFALYLSHTLTKGIWFTLIGGQIVRFGSHSYISWALFYLGIAVAVAVALALEKWVDRPLTIWVDNKLRRFTTR